MLDTFAMFPACFTCHSDCATGCHTDDQPYDHPYYAYDHPPHFEEDDHVDDAELQAPKGDPDTDYAEEQEGTQGTVSVQQDIIVPMTERRW